MKHLIFMLLLAATSLTAAADTLTITELFKDMPDEIVPYLSRNNRLDFIDFMESKMKAEVTNDFGGKSEMTALGPDSISIRLNESCRLDLLLLTTTHDVDSCRQVIAVVRTFGNAGDIQESDEPQFFSVNWKRLSEAPDLTADSKKRLQLNVKPANIIEILNKKLNKN